MTPIDMPKRTGEEGGASTLYNPIPGSQGMLRVGKIVFPYINIKIFLEVNHISIHLKSQEAEADEFL